MVFKKVVESNDRSLEDLSKVCQDDEENHCKDNSGNFLVNAKDVTLHRPDISLIAL